MQKIASYLGNTAELEQIANANRNMLQVFQEQITKGHLTAVFNSAKDPADLLVKMRALESLAQSGGPESLISKKLLEEANVRLF